MQKVRSRKAPVFGKVDKVVAPKGYLATSEGGPASETLQSIRSDLLTNGQVVWVKSQQALYAFNQTGTAPAFPLGIAASPTGCWRRVAPELYQFGAGAPTVDAAYGNSTFGRLKIKDSYFQVNDYAIRTYGTIINLSEIRDSRLSNNNVQSVEAGMTCSVMSNVDFESNPGPCVSVSSPANFDFSIECGYFENITTGNCCINIDTANRGTVKDCQAVTNVTVPLLRIRQSKFIQCPEYPIVARSASDCNTGGILIPGTTDTFSAASWRLQHSGNAFARLGSLPYTVTNTSDVNWSTTKIFGDKSLAARQIGTVGVPASRLLNWLINTPSFVPGAAVCLFFAMRYENSSLPENFCSFVVDARRQSDNVYETSVWDDSIYALNFVQTNNTVQFMLLLRNAGVNEYNQIRFTWYPYGNNSDLFYDGFISPIAW